MAYERYRGKASFITKAHEEILGQIFWWERSSSFDNLQNLAQAKLCYLHPDQHP